MFEPLKPCDCLWRNLSMHLKRCFMCVWTTLEVVRCVNCGLDTKYAYVVVCGGRLEEMWKNDFERASMSGTDIIITFCMCFCLTWHRCILSRRTFASRFPTHFSRMLCSILRFKASSCMPHWWATLSLRFVALIPQSFVSEFVEMIAVG